MFAAAARGEVPESMPHEWAHETPSMKRLPEHVKKKKKKASSLTDLFLKTATYPGCGGMP